MEGTLRALRKGRLPMIDGSPHLEFRGGERYRSGSGDAGVIGRKPAGITRNAWMEWLVIMTATRLFGLEGDDPHDETERENET